VFPHAQPLGSVHRTAQLVQLLPHAHSGHTMQQPVEPSLQLARSSATVAGHNQTANDQSSRQRMRTLDSSTAALRRRGDDPDRGREPLVAEASDV
jgi:hypothetical protein